MLGCIDLQAMNALGAAMNYLLAIGLKNIRERIFELTDYLITGLQALPIKFASPVATRQERSAIVSFNIGDRTKGLWKELMGKKILTSYRLDNIRVALNIFNTKEEIDFLLESIRGHI